ncbi:MAG: hypothetical protein K0R83_799 [Caulobacter sp.]|nr:hypothetical protein [Caulobacter sp.]
MVGTLAPLPRFSRKYQLTFADLEFGESARAPHEVALPNRNFVNLFEAPVLFYPAMLAWIYVGLRALLARRVWPAG